MPIYEFECCNNSGNCGHKFAVMYNWRDADGITVLDDPDMQLCVKCGDNTDQLFSRCLMKPDRFWAGLVDDRLDKYWTSESRFNKYLKDNDLLFIGDRTDREGLTKMAEQGMREKDKKAEKDVDNVIIDTLAWKDEFGLTGTVKQRNKRARAIALAESADSSLVCEDPAFK